MVEGTSNAIIIGSPPKERYPPPRATCTLDPPKPERKGKYTTTNFMIAQTVTKRPRNGSDRRVCMTASPMIAAEKRV